MRIEFDVSRHLTQQTYGEAITTPPKFNSEFTPEKWWLKDDPFLLGPGNFSGAISLKLRWGRGVFP